MNVGLIFCIVFIVLAFVFLTGKGDMLIAGYNTASEEERKKVNIHRLRIVMAIISVITAVFCIFLAFNGENQVKSMTATFFYIVITIGFVIFANIWPKKK
jgi:uncharacterized membrane protein